MFQGVISKFSVQSQGISSDTDINTNTNPDTDIDTDTYSDIDIDKYSFEIQLIYSIYMQHISVGL